MIERQPADRFGDDARRLLADYAAAGLVRSYALVIETTEVDRRKAIVRGAAVPVDLWQRVVREGATPDVWTGGTVRLQADDLIGGAPGVDVTGIGFHKGDLDRLVDHHGGRASGAKHHVEVTPETPTTGPGFGEQVRTGARRRKPNPAAIPPGAIFATVAQTEAALGFGRTKINEMMNDGRLVKHKIDGATRIEVASIMALAGVAD